MRPLVIYLLMLVFFSSCKNEEKPIITDKYKINFIHNILSDTIILSGNYKNPFIFKKKWENKFRPINTIRSTKYKSNLEIISFMLNEIDTSFINQQMLETFNPEKLNHLGYKGINWDNIIRREYKSDSLVSEINLVGKDSLSNIYKSLEKNKSIHITNPIFNSTLDRAYIEVDFMYYRGEGYIYEIENKKWKFVGIGNTWIR